MTLISRLCLLLCAFALAACTAGTGPVSPTVSEWQLADVNVTFGPQIARTATGEEFASNFLWAGSGEGNRKRQVVRIFRDAGQIVGREAMTGSRPVEMDVEVTYFHGMPEWARYMCCGYENIQANLAVRDAATGAVLAQGENISMSRVGLGGVPKAIAELSGRSERDLVLDAIVNGMRGWLADIR